MYDTVHLKLLQCIVLDINFLEEIPKYLTGKGEHIYESGTVITGHLGNLKVSVSRYALKIKGSLCKWYLGDNLQTMTRKDTQLAIEKLSKLLNVPIEKAFITRFDVAQNFVMNHPVKVYMNHLGNSSQYRDRLSQPNGLYYNRQNGQLVFYDKIKELKKSREFIHELYQNKNVIRFEQRHLMRVSKIFNVEQVTGAMLYDETFYIDVVRRWKYAYDLIDKINDIALNTKIMKTKTDLYKMGIIALIERFGGKLGLLGQIDEARMQGDLTKKQCFDLKNAINNVAEIKDGFTKKNEAIEELSRKVNEATKYYR